MSSLSLSLPLALKSPTGTYYYTHGNDESLEDVAGAEFQRTVDKSGPHPMEVLTSIGPLSERITIEVGSRIHVARRVHK